MPAAAPVSSDDRRAAHGVELTKLILAILAGSIALLMLYLGVLDLRTSSKVDRLYERIFDAVRPIQVAETKQIDEALEGLRALETATTPVPPQLVAATTTAIREAIGRFRPSGTEAVALNQCIQAVQSAPSVTPTAATPPGQAPLGQTTTATPEHAPPPSNTPPAPEPEKAPTAAAPPAAPTPAGAPPLQATGPTRDDAHPGPTTRPPSENARPAQTNSSSPSQASAGSATPETRAATANCVRILERVRAAAGGPIETERLRLLRDFAKDVHDNHQGLRTFWISAAQLILLNLLLPLLTALLGYIFGRQSASQ